MDEKNSAHEDLVSALRTVLTEGSESDKAILIQRIPFICKDILEIKTNLGWMKWLGGGIVIGVGYLALHSLGASVL